MPGKQEKEWKSKEYGGKDLEEGESKEGLEGGDGEGGYDWTLLKTNSLWVDVLQEFTFNAN